ncbi:hypothetical protein TorRG33x02_221130 [Trema orientale]|uniref:Uncharacterized protein n=1 Tax=Trema orientale TaxID=63057 RepID=A0A2P5E989_TREOI|nr:hypothetical protein TorRG33x02_221130 [Trema orientale]
MIKGARRIKRLQVQIKDPDLAKKHVSNASKLSKFSKSISIGGKSWRHEGANAMQKSGYLVGTSSQNKSVNEQLPASSSSFVKLADLNEKDWTQFLETFQGLLAPAFAN